MDEHMADNGKIVVSTKVEVSRGDYLLVGEATGRELKGITLFQKTVPSNLGGMKITLVGGIGSPMTPFDIAMLESMADEAQAAVSDPYSTWPAFRYRGCDKHGTDSGMYGENCTLCDEERKEREAKRVEEESAKEIGPLPVPTEDPA